MVDAFDHPRLGRFPVLGRTIKFAGHDAGRPQPPPGLGEHTREILHDLLGYPAELIDRLAAAGVIGVGQS
jgi:crotonobetainyl-CoA:carnitine CoA-transferase CaiB-like acyl-CoA transferase